MTKKTVSPLGKMASDEKLVLGHRQNQEQIGLANTIKSFHYLLQRRMSDLTAGMTQEVGQKGNEDKDHVVERWFDLIAEEVENMGTYSTAMHDIATSFWNFHKQNPYVYGFFLDAFPAFRGMESACSFQNRDNDGMGGIEKHERGVITRSLRYNDRIEYSLHCVADYYLGTCILPLHADEQRKLDLEHSNDTSLSEMNDAEPSIETTDSVCYAQLPRIAAIAIKEWRRAFYKVNGRQATAREIETAAYNALAFPESGEERGLMGTNVGMGLAADSLFCQTELLTCRQTRAKESAASLAASYILATRDKMRQQRQSSDAYVRHITPFTGA